MFFHHPRRQLVATLMQGAAVTRPYLRRTIGSRGHLAGSTSGQVRSVALESRARAAVQKEDMPDRPGVGTLAGRCSPVNRKYETTSVL